MKICAERLGQKTNWQIILNIFCGIAIILGVAWHLYYFIADRSLWLDEAMLASSVVTRPIFSLASGPLDWGQSASLGWLYLTKLAVMVLGSTSRALRIVSQVSGIGCIVLVYVISSKGLKLRYSLFYTAFFSLIPYYAYYCNEVKPYMFDNMIVLGALLLFIFYRKGNISFNKLVFSYSIMVWLSFSGVFVIGACMGISVIEIIYNCIKNKKISRNEVVIALKCAIVLISTVLYYLVWISSSSNNAGGQDYWDLLRFPVLPHSLSDVKLMINMLRQCLTPIGGLKNEVVYITLGLIALVCTLAKDKKEFLKNPNNTLVLTSVMTIILILVASILGFYPMQDRLLQFWFIPTILILGVGFEILEDGLKERTAQCASIIQSREKMNCPVNVFLKVIPIFMIFIILFLCCYQLRFSVYAYKEGSEVSEAIEYLDENLQEDDGIYVYRSSIPVFSFEADYPLPYSELTDKLLPRVKDGIIYGQSFGDFKYDKPYSYEYDIDEEALKQDVSLIIQNESVYIFTSHTNINAGDVVALIEELKKYGTVETVVNYHNTYMYHWTSGEGR